MSEKDLFKSLDHQTTLLLGYISPDSLQVNT
jgi:hypothetical protein